ncbi:hypothetical protein PN36_32065 [Candidatus Thiomargarita nelsonii]|uniref:Secreted protein n=1 Tax=Candidatus Thiomargarita nelsonii TaxID=1003181 RepID=A0A4E0QJV9_9GAMM|nr:hypothetical protein PN36_32065 [Candidatus Thiomargarita nelsonii]
MRLINFVGVTSVIFAMLALPMASAETSADKMIDAGVGLLGGIIGGRPGTVVGKKAGPVIRKGTQEHLINKPMRSFLKDQRADNRRQSESNSKLFKSGSISRKGYDKLRSINRAINKDIDRLEKKYK